MYDYSSVRERVIAASTEIRHLRNVTALKRRISLMLARMRSENELSQKDIAQKAGWDKGFVSRLEGAQGSIPDLLTLARFAETCGLTIGLVALEQPNQYGQARVIDALSLFSEPRADDTSTLDEKPNLLIGLVDQTLSLEAIP